MNRTKLEIIEGLKKTVMEKAIAFVKKKGHHEKTMVIDLEIGGLYGYLLPPVNALKAAYVANIMQRVGNMPREIELIVNFSASQEFAELDDKIELVADNTMLRLGTLYTYASKAGKDCLQDLVKNTMLETAYKREF